MNASAPSAQGIAPTCVRLNASQFARFTALTALLAIFANAAIGHGLLWENDPYWTYWVTRTFLIATVFGLGTARFGIGASVGAGMTAVHTIVLTVYYWIFPDRPTYPSGSTLNTRGIRTTC